MEKVHYDVEMLDGQTYTGRVLAADKIAMESTARAHGWEMAEGPRLHACLLWHAMRREHGTDYPTFDDFVNALADYRVSNTGDDVDPT